MKQILSLFLIAFALPLFSDNNFLKQRLMKAKDGDYLVIEAGKNVSILCVRSFDRSSIVIEEITAPFKHFKHPPASWADWVKNKAPGHTSWSMVEIDAKEGQIIECYSFSRGAWISLSPKESLIATLLQLPLKTVEKSERRRVGPPPALGEADHRQLWQPPLIYQGKTLEKVVFEALEAKWPHDQSELDGKTVTLYFDKQIEFPLPFWIQVESSHAVGHFRAIDSGRGLASPHKRFPRRAPEFVGSCKKNKNGISLCVKSPKYYRDFELFAVTAGKSKKQIHPVSYSLLKGDGDLLTLQIDRDELKNILKPNDSYTWLLVPKDHSESYIESNVPFTWSDPESLL